MSVFFPLTQLKTIERTSSIIFTSSCNKIFKIKKYNQLKDAKSSSYQMTQWGLTNGSARV